MLLKILFVIVLLSMTIFSQTPPVETGVSQTLAKWRAANYSDVRYKLNITLEKGAPLMKGDIEIRVNLTDEGAKNDLILDWRTTQFANDKDKPYVKVTKINESDFDNIPVYTDTRNEHLVLPKGFFKAGENVIKINFASPIKTSGAAITRYVDKEDGAEYVYSLFVPSDASTAFPVFDQPDLKARFKLGILAPDDWKVVSNETSLTFPNAEYIRNEQTGEKFEIPHKKGMSYTSFRETKSISSYIFAFAAGGFEIFYGSKFPEAEWNATRNIYVRKSQAEKFKQHAAETFRLNREAVKYLESYFDYKFPFPKYDLVLIPEFPFGGMEHAGATFLRESSVIFPSEPTKNDYVSRANVIFHEAAHQWFGDTVTMKWFDDLWLKEGFAEFMAYKTLEKVLPEYNAWKIFYERNKQAAYLTDSTKGTTPIYQEIPNLSSAKSAYGNIVYRKAPSFLRQAEFYLGEDKFQTAVRAFLKKHEFANAEWTDLVKEFETASKQDLKDWANAWVKQDGLGKFKVYGHRGANTDGITYYSLRQIVPLNNTDKEPVYNYWKQKLNILVINEDNSQQTFSFDFGGEFVWKPKIIDESDLDETSKIERYIQVNNIFVKPIYYINDKGKKVSLSSELLRPKLIFPNYQDCGYGIFLLDEKSRAYVLANIQNEKDDFLRTMMWGALWDSVRETELAPKDYVELVIKNINVETDESTIQTLLGRVSTAMNYYLSDAQAAELAPRLEAMLIDKIANAKTPGQRITFYRAFLNLASSAKSAQILKDILAGKSKVAVFNLKTKDKFDIVTRLLILGDKDAPNLLATLEKTEISDEAKRYAYAARAGIGTADAKAQYFKDFIKNKEISESWIEAALNPFNSVRHSDLTAIYLETALSELPNLKRNRKIFFINGWLSAFIGGQRSAESSAIVNKFLADNPNLDKDLRLKILENVDGLERAVKIRTKYGK